MKKITTLLLLVLLCACQQDDLISDPSNNDQSGTPDDVTFVQNFGASTTSNFIGRVVDKEGNSISNVQITIGNAFTTTDFNGVFVLNNVSVYEKFAYVKASKEGYIHGSRAIIPAPSGINDIQITLLERNIVDIITSGQESEVIYNGSKVQFSGDFVDSNGQPYNGQVSVSMHYVAPNTRNTFTQMPGMLFAQDNSNEAVALETYGMLAIDLYSAGGDPLNIAEGAPATVEFPVDTEQMGIAPDTIELWYFDEETGYWKEEGTATKSGDKYIAEVTHFSWWNCDLPRDYIEACFSINTDETYLPNHYVQITREENGQTIFGGYTNSDGMECGLFPANEQVRVIVYSTPTCGGQVAYEAVLGPYSDDISFTINLEQYYDDSSVISGTFNDCNGNPLTNGYAFIYNASVDSVFSNAHVIAVTDGTMSYNLAYCNQNSNDYKIIVYDINAGQNSGEIALDLTEGTTVLDTIITCEETGGSYTDNVVLMTQQEVDAFGALGYSIITGYLTIGNQASEFLEPTDIHSLAALQNLTRIDGGLHLGNNPELTSLQGLHNIEELGSALYVNDCDALNSLSVLSSITNAETVGSVRIWHNASLQNLNGLEVFSSAATIDITNNQQLQSLDGLFPYTTLVNMFVVDNEGLTSLSGLNNLQATGKLYIVDNDNITSLEGLENLEAVTESGYAYPVFAIQENDGLLTLDGLENLMTVNGIWSIHDNTSLSDFCAIQNILANGNWVTYAYGNNAYNPHSEDIINGDCVQ